MLIEEIMIKDVITLSPDTYSKRCLQVMQEKKIRHLPIVSDDNGCCRHRYRP